MDKRPITYYVRSDWINLANLMGTGQCIQMPEMQTGRLRLMFKLVMLHCGIWVRLILDERCHLTLVKCIWPKMGELLLDSCLKKKEWLLHLNTFSTGTITYRYFATHANWVTMTFINSIPFIILHRAFSTGSTPLVTGVVCLRKT